MVRVCVVGCLHGELDKVYADIEAMDQESGRTTQLVLCCGDFQSLRNPTDLHSMSVPTKYYNMGDFYRYYSEEVKAPIPTVFVGGNHEASNYLQELPYGGWVAPNIWYMGYTGVVQFAGLRIAGLSGIYKLHDYSLGHYEHPPYSDATKRSVYHLRNLEVFRLGQVSRRLDIVISHDWPRGIYHYGNTADLLSRKRHFKEEVQSNTLGSPPAEQLLCRLRPRYWFAAHMHCKFAAVVAHKDKERSSTKFLALDKCLPSRDYLQFLDIEPDPVSNTFDSEGKLSSVLDVDAPIIASHPPAGGDSVNTDDEEPSLMLDPEWMCILRSTNEFLSLTQIPCMLPGQGGQQVRSYAASVEDIESLWDPFMGVFTIPENFERTAPVYKPDDMTLKNNQRQLVELANEGAKHQKQPFFSNPQTELLCAMLELTNPNAALLGQESYNLKELATHTYANEEDDEEEEIEEVVDNEKATQPDITNPDEYDPIAALPRATNPEEISLDSFDENDDTGSSTARDNDDNVYHPELFSGNPGAELEDDFDEVGYNPEAPGVVVRIPSDDCGRGDDEYNPEPVVKNPEVINIDDIDDNESGSVEDDVENDPTAYDPRVAIADHFKSTLTYKPGGGQSEDGGAVPPDDNVNEYKP